MVFPGRQQRIRTAIARAEQSNSLTGGAGRLHGGRKQRRTTEGGEEPEEMVFHKPRSPAMLILSL